MIRPEDSLNDVSEHFIRDEAFLLMHFFYISKYVDIMTQLSVLIAFYNQMKLIQKLFYLITGNMI